MIEKIRRAPAPYRSHQYQLCKNLLILFGWKTWVAIDISPDQTLPPFIFPDQQIQTMAATTVFAYIKRMPYMNELQWPWILRLPQLQLYLTLNRIFMPQNFEMQRGQVNENSELHSSYLLEMQWLLRSKEGIWRFKVSWRQLNWIKLIAINIH